MLNGLYGWFCGLLLIAQGGAGGAGASPVEAGEAGGFSGFLLSFYGQHRFLYALAMVAFLLAVGVLLGVLTEAALSLVGLRTEGVNRVE